MKEKWNKGLGKTTEFIVSLSAHTLLKGMSGCGEGQGSPVSTEVGAVLEWTAPLLFPEPGFLLGFWEGDVEHARRGSEIVLKSKESTYSKWQVKSASI